jgi:hypothetical protein
MKNSLMLPSMFLLTACGGGGNEPLSKDNTAPPSSNTAQCGNSFSAQRHFDQKETNIAYWQIEGDSLQTKPQVAFSTSKSSSLSETSYKGTEALCEQVANIFGADVRETWQGAENDAIKQGQQFKYTPELTVSFALPGLESLDDWLAQGSPSSMPTSIIKSTLTVWYENNDEQKFLQGDLSNNQKSLALSCDEESYTLSIELYEIDEQLSSNLNPAFCEETRNANTTATSCLKVSMQQEKPIGSCQFELTDVLLPDSQGNKTSVKLAAQVSAANDSGIMMKITNVDIN